MEKEYRDLPLEALKKSFSPDTHFPLYVHLIQAFGYREAWAAPLLEYIRLDSAGRPYFPKNPQTPEAHRHKFLCVLTLSDSSPGNWRVHDREVRSEDFVEAILSGPLADWGDDSVFPEPSWTFQFLSAHLDGKGSWKGSDTPLAQACQACLVRYYREYERGALYERGKTIFTESGLHLVEAVNKLCQRQAHMVVEPATQSSLNKFFPAFKNHFFSRLKDSMIQIEALLNAPSWPRSDQKEKYLGLAISNLLASGHLLETAFHPRGALLHSYTEEEGRFLNQSSGRLEKLMEFFFETEILNLMSEVQKKAYRFPLFHAYRALQTRGGFSL
jgi:hypothetical protein